MRTGSWTAAAASADGSRLLALSEGHLLVSLDCGVSWEQRSAHQQLHHQWRCIACSADASRIFLGALPRVVDGKPAPLGLFASTDSGASFKWVSSAGQLTDIVGAAASADGSRLFTLCAKGMQALSVSCLNGPTRLCASSSHEIGGSAAAWSCVATSACGSHLVAGVAGDGKLRFSSDSGATWAERGERRSWQCVASSADGSRVVAGAADGLLYRSVDSGETWAAI